MENQSSTPGQNTPAPLTAEEVINRQLTAWQLFHQQLNDESAPLEHLDYIEEQITELQGQLANLNAGN